MIHLHDNWDIFCLGALAGIVVTVLLLPVFDAVVLWVMEPKQ